MAARVVDTNIVSFQFKGDSRAALYHPHLVGHSLVISFMTLAELDLWAAVHHWGAARRGQLEANVHRHFLIHPYDRPLCTTWAAATHEARQAGPSPARTHGSRPQPLPSVVPS